MSTEEIIANLALAHLGDEATIATINPPEGSEQAEHASQFFGIARDIMLQAHPWSFSTRRQTLEKLSVDPISGWTYAYRRPNNALQVFAVIPPNAGDDYSLGYQNLGSINTPQGIVSSPNATGNVSYQPVAYTTESFEDGTQVILTDLDQAVGRIGFRVTDVSVYTPMASLALSYVLASFLAGPIYKGDVGMKMSEAMMVKFTRTIAQAIEANAMEGHENVQVSTPWIAGR